MSVPIASLIQVLKHQIDAFTTLDADKMIGTFAKEGAVLQDMADPDHPYEGREAIHGFLADYFSKVRNASATIVTATTNDDTVVGELEMRFTWVAEPFTAENGRDIMLRYVVYDTVRDGEIAHERFYWNPGELEAQLAE